MSPLLPGPWHSLDADEAAAFARRLSHALDRYGDFSRFPRGRPLGGMRALPLSFYPGWLLIEGEVQIDSGLVGTFDILFGPGFIWPLYGTSDVLHELNDGMIRVVSDSSDEDGPPRFLPSPLVTLDAVRAGPDYLRFFCGAVWGDEGPFMLVESPADPALALIESADDTWREHIAPVACSVEGDGTLQARAAVRYGSGLFAATFRLKQGLVTMEGDEPIADFAAPPERFASPLRALRAGTLGDAVTGAC